MTGCPGPVANTVYLEDLNLKYTGKSVQPDTWMNLSNTIWHGLWDSGFLTSTYVYQENSVTCIYFY